MLPFAGFFYHLLGFFLLGCTDYLGMGLNNARLLHGNFLQGISQKFHVVHTDRGNDLQKCGSNHIGSVQSPSKPCLQHYHITFFLLKIEKSQSSLHLENRRCSRMLLRHIFHSL